MLLDDIARIAARKVTLAPGHLDAECANTHRLDATAAERIILTVPEVVAALLAAANALRAGVTGPAVFYLWHDEPSAQLRCGITSRPPHDLPLATDYRLTSDLTGIVESFMLADPKAAVPAELDLTTDDPDPPDDPPLPVWTHPL